MNKELHAANELLEMCRVKLEIYRDHTDGEYHGGVEHVALIRMIDEWFEMTGHERKL